MRRATPNDALLLVDLMNEFYAEAGLQLNRSRAGQAFDALLADDRLGSAWIIQSDAQDAGYLVLALKFAMEYGGTAAILDDLFVRKAFRGMGLASEALAELREFCERSQVRGISVEVGPENGAARALYRRSGFVETDHLLLNMALGDPLHAT